MYNRHVLALFYVSLSIYYIVGLHCYLVHLYINLVLVICLQLPPPGLVYKLFSRGRGGGESSVISYISNCQ